MAKGVKDWINTYGLNYIQGKKMRVCEGSKAAQSDVRTIRTIRCTVGKTNTYVDQYLSVYSSHDGRVLY